MIRKTLSSIKKWANAHLNKSASQNIANRGRQGSQAQPNPHPDLVRAEAPAELDEDTANAVVVTWNLLNPP